MRVGSLMWAILLLPSCKTTSSSLQGTLPLPSYNVQKANEVIKVDGALSEKAWSRAGEIPFVFPWATGEVTESSIAKILWDDQNLYVGYDNVDHYIQSTIKEFDGPVFKDDCVEIFVAPDAADVSRYMGFEMNVLGTLLDYTAAKAGDGATKSFDYPWNSDGVEIKTSLKEKSTLNNNSDVDKGWVLEMKIPLKNFASLQKTANEKPKTWRANLNRCKGSERGEYGTWSNTHVEKPNFHVSQYFGYLHFVE